MSTTDLSSFNALPTYKQDILLAVNALRGRVGFFMDSGPLIWKLIDAAEMHVLKGGKVEDYVGTARAVLARTNAVHSSQVLAQVNEEMAKLAALTEPAPTSEEIEALVEEVDEFEGVQPFDVAPSLALTTPAGVVATPFGWLPEALPPTVIPAKPLFANTEDGDLLEIAFPPKVTPKAKPSPELEPSPDDTGEFDALPIDPAPALSFDETMLNIAPAWRMEGSPLVFVRSRTTKGKVYSVAGGRSCSCPATRSCWHQQAANFAQRWEDTARGFFVVGLSPRQIAAMWRGLEAKHGRDVVGAMIEFIDG